MSIPTTKPRPAAADLVRPNNLVTLAGLVAVARENRLPGPRSVSINQENALLTLDFTEPGAAEQWCKFMGAGSALVGETVISRSFTWAGFRGLIFGPVAS